MGSIRNFLKRIMPPPVRTFLREVEGLRQMTEQQTQLLEQGQRETLEAVERLAAEQWTLEEKLSRLLKSQTEQAETLRWENKALKQALEAQSEKLDQMEQALATANENLAMQGHSMQTMLRQAEEQRAQLGSAVEKVRLQSVEGMQYASEAVWAETFNNTISGSRWLKNTAFSPGRWAVGYPALYAMYRVLNETRPRRILELGLGQSTRMIAQYAAAHEGVEHVVVEHDPGWIAFFQNDFAMSGRSRIVQMDREMVSYKDAETVRVFMGFREAFAGQKFDFIFIDAPLGGDMKQYARIDVLGLLPDCLTEDFVIMIDDAERSGETRSIMEMRKRLDEAGILYKYGRYSGRKDAVMICAEHKGFLTTM